MRYCTDCPDVVVPITSGAEAPRISGYIQFYQENGCVLIVARISGLSRESKTGFFRFHIHQGGSCSGARGHILRLERIGFSVNEIIGRTMVIHSDPDDFHTQPAGNAGKKSPAV